MLVHGPHANYPEAKGTVWKVSRDDGAGECLETAYHVPILCPGYEAAPRSVLGRPVDLNGSGGAVAGLAVCQELGVLPSSRQSFPWPLAGLPTCSPIPPPIVDFTTVQCLTLLALESPDRATMCAYRGGKDGGSIPMR